MTTPPSLPTLPGLGWSRHKLPKFNTRIASHVSGREIRVPLQPYALYEFEATYNGMTSAASNATGLGASSLQSLMGFYLQAQGQANTFLYTDPDDSSIAGGAIATGNGSTQAFLITRNLGGAIEPVSWVTGVTNVYLNGVAQPSADWLFTAPNLLGFATAPGSGVAITADFTFAFQCRFLEDQIDFEEFMSALWKLDSLKFRSVVANTSTTTAVIPTWYTPYQIGGTNPTLFADTTTEGVSNHYLYNGTTYSSFAALLTAISGTYTNSTGKYVTNSSGALTKLSANALPFDYTWNGSAWVAAGLLLEAAGTNYLYPSNNVSGWNTAYFGGSLTQSGTGPDGVTNSAIHVQNDTSTNFHSPFVTVSGLSSGPLTLSLYAKAGSTGGWLMLGTTVSTGQAAYFNLNTGALGSVGSGASASITAVGNGWYRVSVTFTFSGSGSYFGVVPCSANLQGNYAQATFAGANDDVYIYGAQVEQANFASSYVLTTSGTASRSADSLSVPWTATTFTARSKATMAIEIDGNSILDAGNGLLTQASGPDAKTSNGTQSLTTSITAFTSSNIIVVGGSSSGRVLSANGNTAASDANALVPSAPTEIQIGANTSDANNSEGHYAQIGLWTVAATATQAAANSGTA